MVWAKRAKVPTIKTLTEKCKSKCFGNKGYIALSFIIPFVLMSCAFAYVNIAPFGIIRTAVSYILFQISDLIGIEVNVDLQNPWGDGLMHVVDMWHQYFPFLVDLHDKLQSGGSLFWSWSVGLGTNFIAMMSYYLLSPLNFLSAFFPADALESYIAVATAIKIACAGMFTAICFKIVFKKTTFAMVFFSTMFSFCAFNMGYYWNIIWLDSMAMLPLVVAGTISLLRDGKYKLFIISLALAVTFNYYIGIFICAAVLLTSIGYTASCWQNLRKALKDLLRTVASSAIALMLTALITIPAYLALQNCYKSVNRMPTGLDINIGADSTAGIIDAFHKVLSNTLSFIVPCTKESEGMPNIACGLLCLVMLGIFFCSKKIRKGEKIFCVSALTFLVISFIFRRLDFIWHGFHYPNMIPYRFSFLMSFLLIFMAYRAYLVLKDSSFADVFVAAIIFASFVLLYFMRSYIEVEEGAKNYASYNKNIMTACIIIGAFMLLGLLAYTLRLVPKRFLSIFLCLIIIGEMGVTAVIGVNTVSGGIPHKKSSYPYESEKISILLDSIEERTADETPDIYRVEVSTTSTLNDGAINGYNGISMFNSMANVTVNRFLGNLGGAENLAGNRYTYYDSSPVTNVIFNLRYLLARNGSVSHAGPSMQMIDSADGMILYENLDYINMGYLANSELADFLIPENNDSTAQDREFTDPFENQIDFWRKATGIEEPLYTPIDVTSTAHSKDPSHFTDGCDIFYTSSGAKTMNYKFSVPQDGQVYTYFYISGAQDKKGHIYINDAFSHSVTADKPYITGVGTLKKGDQISLRGTIASSSWVRAYCYILNEDVYHRGLDVLKSSTLNTTVASDTKLAGTINADRDGILYTSIPYEKGWSVKVDGKTQDIIPLGVVYPDPTDPDNPDKSLEGGMCCVALTKGEHTIEFSYTPAGFKPGLLIFIVALITLIFFWVCTSKRFRTKSFAKPVLWLFDPNVKGMESESLCIAENTETTESEVSEDTITDTEDSEENE